MADEDRRKHRRFTLGKWGRVVLSPIGTEAPGQLIDMSSHGASITTRWAVTAGVGVFVSFRAGGQACEATGSVVRVFPFGELYGLAVELGYANPEFLGFLRALEAAPEASRPDMLDTIEELVVSLGA